MNRRLRDESSAPPGARVARRVVAALAAATLAAWILSALPAAVAADAPLAADWSAATPPGALAGDWLSAPPDACYPDDAPLPFCGPIHERARLTGEWFGARTALWDHGITFDIRTTQFYQGVARGGLEQSFPYGGRNDYFLGLDGEALGLWQGFSVKLHGETRFGQSPNFITGALSPVNEYLLVPGSEGVVSGLTAVEFNQFLSEDTLIYAGKINLLDHIKQPLTGATGLEGFMNTSLIFNTILARTLPYSAFGGGYVYLQDGEPVIVLSVYDTRNAPTTSVFDDLFGNGAVLFGTVILPTCFFGLPGHQGVEAVYSSGKYTNFQESPYLDPVGGLVFPGPPIAGSWALGYLFDQALWVSPDDPRQMWGVFGKIGIADDNPNPLQWTASAGVSGTSPLRSWAGDTFGAAWFYLGLSEVLQQSALPLSPLGHEQGVELYYNCRLTPWLQITPDLQIIDPFQRQADTAIVAGLRALLDF